MEWNRMIDTVCNSFFAVVLVVLSLKVANNTLGEIKMGWSIDHEMRPDGHAARHLEEHLSENRWREQKKRGALSYLLVFAYKPLSDQLSSKAGGNSWLDHLYT